MKNSTRKARAIKALEGASTFEHAYVIIKVYKDNEGYFYEYVGLNDNLSNYLIFNPNDPYIIDEVYNLSLDIVSQLEEDRTYHIEKFINKEKTSNLDKIRNEIPTFDNRNNSFTKKDIMSLISLIDKSIYKEAIIYESKNKKLHIEFVKNCDLDTIKIIEELQNSGNKIISCYNLHEYNLEIQAYEFAKKKHFGQYRKNIKEKNEEYINHPIRVANLIKYYETNNENLEDLICASFLHDTLEDTNTSFEELVSFFGYKIAYLVKELTNNDAMKNTLGKSEYLSYKLVELSESALTIKLCDRLDNICSTVNADISFRNKYIKETIEILEYLQNNRNLTFIQKEIIKDIVNEMERIHIVTKRLALN